ncbi:glycosyl transferase family 90-domain-containing protein [Mycena amicta]|nr:glycosyl transferase family 90-domain-containing protein [Mycena amicta]
MHKVFKTFRSLLPGRPTTRASDVYDDVEDGDVEDSVPLLPVGAKGGMRRNNPRLWKSYTEPGRAGVVVALFLVSLGGAAMLGIALGTLVLGPMFSSHPSESTLPDIARAHVDALFARQSTTLAQASARYTLRTGRPPPRAFPAFFEFAKERACLIDEYDRVHRDFKAFHELERVQPGWFRSRVERAASKLDGLNGVDISRVELRNGEVSLAGGTAYDFYWPTTIQHFSAHLPNMTFLVNGRDEPRVVFDLRKPASREAALSPPSDEKPFTFSPPPGKPTEDWFAGQSGCGAVPADDGGLLESANPVSGFLLSPAKPGFTTDLYPMLSMAKLSGSPCFSDMLFPTEYYYDRSWWAPHFSYPEDVPWEKKFNQLYWRGMSNGGMIVVSPSTNYSNYHSFPRFRLASLALEHPDLINAEITTFAETLCLPENGCDRDAIMQEYGITGVGAAREEVYAFKYAMDVDGTTFSGRFLSLLRSGALVFKSTIFEEFHSEWLRPYEHYLPVLPDLSDLVEKLQWAEANPDEARLIQLRGMEVAKRVMTDDQNDCYYLAALGEWAELWGLDPVEGNSDAGGLR